MRILTTRVTSEAVQLLLEAIEVEEAVVGTVGCVLEVAVVEAVEEFLVLAPVELEDVAITLPVEEVEVGVGLSLVHISATHCAQGRAALKMGKLHCLKIFNEIASFFSII